MDNYKFEHETYESFIDLLFSKLASETKAKSLLNEAEYDLSQSIVDVKSTEKLLNSFYNFL